MLDVAVVAVDVADVDADEEDDDDVDDDCVLWEEEAIADIAVVFATDALSIPLSETPALMAFPPPSRMCEPATMMPAAICEAVNLRPCCDRVNNEQLAKY